MINGKDIFRLEKWSAAAPDRVAVQDDTGSYTYAALYHRVRMCVGGLRQIGIQPGQHILLCMPNGEAFIRLFLAASGQGIIVDTMNPLLMEKEVSEFVKATRPAAIFAERQENVEHLAAAAPNTPIFSVERWETVCASVSTKEVQTEAETIDPEKTGLVVCTSGSTGHSKYVELSYQALVIPAMDIAQRFHSCIHDVSYIPVPMCQMFGMMGLLVTLMTGGTIITTQSFDAETALELIERFHVTLQYCVPTMYAREIRQYECAENKPNIRSLRTGMIAGAPTNGPYFEWFEKNAGCRLLAAYGLTECSAIAMADYYDTREVRYHTAGKVCIHADVQIRDEVGWPLPTGIPGEIVCNSPGVMNAYKNAPALTKTCFTEDGWFLTGDIGKIDRDGNLIITGRKKDMIIRNGYNVFPAEVEVLLQEHPKVLQAAVTGLADEEKGEAIIAFVVLKPGMHTTGADLREYMKKRIAKYKIPDHIFFLADIPKLPTGKIDYRGLKHRYRALATADKPVSGKQNCADSQTAVICSNQQ